MRSVAKFAFLAALGLLSVGLGSAFASHAYAGYHWSYSDPAYHIDNSLYNLDMVDESNPATLTHGGAAKWNGFSNFNLHPEGGSWGYYGSESLPSSIAGVTYTYVYPFTKIIYDSITNYNVNLKWAAYDCSDCNPRIFNLDWVATHESGHWVSLEDITDTGSVMHYLYYSGHASVDNHSKQTVQSIYGE